MVSRKNAPVAGIAAYLGEQFSRNLTPLAPQPRHKTAAACPFPRSEGLDYIFRNEGVTASNPVESTTDVMCKAISRARKALSDQEGGAAL